MRKRIQHWDKMYEMPLERIPWEIQTPPKELVSLMKGGGTLKDGTALDLGCGTGNYSFYLAQKGFNVIGVDFSKKALEIAEKRNEKLQLPVTFKWADVTKLREVLPTESFDFVFDYSLLHHLIPSAIEPYARQFKVLIKPGGKLLLICYSEKDEFANGNSAATGTYGNTMYYRTADTIKEAYRDFILLEYHETRLGKRNHHYAHSFLFERP